MVGREGARTTSRCAERTPERTARSAWEPRPEVLRGGEAKTRWVRSRAEGGLPNLEVAGSNPVRCSLEANEITEVSESQFAASSTLASPRVCPVFIEGRQ